MLRIWDKVAKFVFSNFIQMIKGIGLCHHALTQRYKDRGCNEVSDSASAELWMLCSENAFIIQTLRAAVSFWKYTATTNFPWGLFENNRNVCFQYNFFQNVVLLLNFIKQLTSLAPVLRKGTALPLAQGTEFKFFCCSQLEWSNTTLHLTF